MQEARPRHPDTGASPEEGTTVEFSATDVASDLQDLSDVSLADIAETLIDEEAAETMRRVAPDDGTRLLVAASFNSAI